jgi:hypothetical protein
VLFLVADYARENRYIVQVALCRANMDLKFVGNDPRRDASPLVQELQKSYRNMKLVHISPLMHKNIIMVRQFLSGYKIFLFSLQHYVSQLILPTAKPLLFLLKWRLSATTSGQIQPP